MRMGVKILLLIEVPNGLFDPNRDYDEMVLRSTQLYLNDQLRARGHLMLNDALDQLGVNRTKMGYRLGWLMQEGKPLNHQWVELRIANNPGIDDHLEVEVLTAGDIWDLL